MTIDRVVVNLYTCCKCKHQWTRWNGNGSGNGDRDAETTTTPIPITLTIPLPRRCSKCKSANWNQRYLDEEISLIDRLQTSYMKQD
jgi:hypothetical protein